MRPSLFLIFLSFVFLPALSAQDLSAFENETFQSEAGHSLPYRILYPENYDKTQAYPLILFLHGAGERGADNELQLVHGAKLFLEESNRRRFPAFVVVPQCPKEQSWNSIKSKRSKNGRKMTGKYSEAPTPSLQAVIELVAELQEKLPLDPSRLYVGGLSMGGMGTFELMSREGAQFAAAMPICGGGYRKELGQSTSGAAFWIFHGADDATVPVQWSRNMKAALTAKGVDVTYSEYPGVKHNSWDNAFAEEELFPWLFAQRKK
jgi:predicted peptidase